MDDPERSIEIPDRPAATRAPEPGPDSSVAIGLTDEVSQAVVPYLASAPEVNEAVGEATQAAATHVALGAVLLVTDGLASAVRNARGEEPGGPGGSEDAARSSTEIARRVAIGAAFDAQRRAAAVTDATTKVVGPTVGWIAASPLLSPARRFVEERVERVYERGVAEEETARDLAARTAESSASLGVPVVLDHVDVGAVLPTVLDQIDIGQLLENVLSQIDMEQLVGGILDELDLSPLVNSIVSDLDLAPVVDNVLQDIDLGPVIDKALANLDINELIGNLEVGSVVLDVTGGMSSEILGSVRDRGADGDALVELIFSKIFRRKRELPPVAFPTYAASVSGADALETPER